MYNQNWFSSSVYGEASFQRQKMAHFQYKHLFMAPLNWKNYSVCVSFSLCSILGAPQGMYLIFMKN